MFLLLMFNVFIASAQFTVAPELGLSALSYNGAGVGWKPAIKVGASVEYMFQFLNRIWIVLYPERIFQSFGRYTI